MGQRSAWHGRLGRISAAMKNGGGGGEARRATIVTTTPVAPAGAAGSATAADTPLLQLTLPQVKQFIRDGFLVLQIDGVPAKFHEGVYTKARELRVDASDRRTAVLREGGRMVAPDAEKREDWSSLAEDFSTLLSSPRVRGALQTLLGTDYVVPAPNNPTPLTANPYDQQFHKDGTSTVVREHCPRTLGAWCEYSHCAVLCLCLCPDIIGCVPGP
eukprot:COSAG01_NODE_1717_length_9398_cov_83.738574_3_plen_215_part_00